MDEHRQGADSFPGLPLHGTPQDHRLSVSITQHYTKLTSTSTHWKVRRSIAIGRQWSAPFCPSDGRQAGLLSLAASRGTTCMAGFPIFHQRLRLAQVNAVVPVRTADLTGTAGRLQAEVQIIPHRVGHL